MVQEILSRRTAAYKAYVATGEWETVEQILSEEKARALILHIERMADRLADRPHLAIQLPTILGPVAPGQHVINVYGVRIIVEPEKAPVIAEQRGNPAGHATFRALVEHAVPAGTRPDRYSQWLIPNVGDDETMRQHLEQDAKRELAKRLREPHVIINVTRDDLSVAEWPLAVDFLMNQVLVVGVAVRAKPGEIKHIVLRPGPGLPPRWIGRDEGVWQARPPYPNELVRPRPRGILPDLETGMLSGLDFGHARPTGRIEVNGEGGIAEVWEVTL